MKKYLVFAMVLVLAVALTSPVSVSAKMKAGAKPGSFFYFFDKAIEKTSLFFTFNPENKAKKVLEYAEERLAEAEELKKEKEEKETLEIKKEETEEVKISEKDIEKTDNKLEEKKNEEQEEQEEKAEIKNNQKEESNKKDEQSKEIEKLKKEVEALKQKTSQIKVIEKIEKPVAVENKQSSSSQTKQKEVTLPNGSVVEMDENGSVVRTIKEAILQVINQTSQNTSSSQGEEIEIKSILAVPDKTSVPASTWHGVNFKISIMKNGQYQAQQNIAVVTPDSTQNRTITTNGISSTGAGDWSGSYSYTPKTVGSHTLIFSWGGISKSVDIQAVEYVKIDPKFERKYVYQDSNVDGQEESVEIPEYSVNYQNATIANFNLSDSDEPFKVESISLKLESDIDITKYIKLANGNAYDWPLNYNSTLYQIKIGDTTGIPIGTHTLTIKEIQVIGQKSGLYRTVTGIPVTFTFIIK